MFFAVNYCGTKKNKKITNVRVIRLRVRYMSSLLHNMPYNFTQCTI